jgi:HEAT repeat protein
MALRRVADPASVPGLLAHAERQEDWGVVNNIVFALAAIGGPTVVPGLMRLARHGNAAVRANAAYTLGQSGDRRAIPVLESMLDDQATDGAMIDGRYTECRVGEVAARSLAQLTR